jgi:glycosyltransferase involved in cell wall biosynthesis
MEAMALKKAVLATDVLGTNELVSNNSTGLLVPFNDQDSLNQAILRLCTDRGLRESLGQAGYQRIYNKFNEHDIVDKWITNYLKLLNKN